MTLELPDFTRARVLVAGDVMLDRYWRGPTSRISPEAPVPVVQVQATEARPGGAANVALNLAALGCAVSLIGVTGRDEPARVLREGMAGLLVDSDWIESPDKPTITKLRILSRNQQVLRLDFEEPLGSAGAFDRVRLLEGFRSRLAGTHLVLLSDYGKGTLSDVQQMIIAARRSGKPVLVDPKGSDYSRYRGASLLTPNVPELEAVVGRCPDEATLVEKGLALIQTLDLAALLVTRSEQGMTLLVPGEPALHLPAVAREVYDVTGAGDTVIATLAAAFAAGSSLSDAVRWSNVAAGIVVGKLGTATVSRSELRQATATQALPGGSIQDEEGAYALVQRLKQSGRRVVMTNGCFDVLHVGHLRYLEEARSLGDALLVAVNDDESVVRLKGPTRPLNRLEDRLLLLSGLRCVDAVVAFSEDTPARLIGRLLPQVLVKGGDYRPEQVAGAEAVKAAGGEVRILGFHDGYSTTGLIDRAQGRRE